MKTFYALIRNIRDVHKQKVISSSKPETEKGKPKENEMKSTWIPSFIWEDFVEYVQQRHDSSVMLLPTTSQNKKQSKTEKKPELDLNLSL
ncbi:hypothetical protein K2173_008833 [Erythroxylum novogranatense]|uniref:Uncharacterized protein n=1 Tax=Erythroxylum novogranatense TaxID=1862640 RepID=A0AAV8U959_9ROSI|nr:hypothetical protein K2173_008833 [Erythroxylum novogranatense]